MPLFSAEVERLFLELADADDATRHQRLSGLAPLLRQQVQRLLELEKVAELVVPASGPLVLTEHPPESLAHFRIDGTLGRGSFGVVYTAHQSDPERTVALKVFHGRATEASADQFRREARALASVRHPAIPRVYEAGTDNGRHWISMDLIEGEPVADWLARDPDRTARLDVVATIADALSAAHAAGVLHRDIKPSNLVIGPNGGAHLLDFGIAATSAHHERAGTPAFMSPEALAGEPLDARSDLYSLARLAEQLIEADGDYVVLLQRSLAPDPGDRHASVAAFAEDLERVRKDRPLPWAATPGRHVTLWAKRNRMLLRAAGVGGVALGGWAALSTVQTSRQLQQTEARYEALQGAVRHALSEGDIPGAQEAVDTFVVRPNNDAVAADVLLWWGELQESRGEDGREALVQAWMRASDRTAVSRALGRAMGANSNWTGVWGLRDVLEQDPELYPLVVRAAEARRDFSLSDAGFAAQASRATPLGAAPWWVARFDGELVEHHRTRLVMPGDVDVPTPHPEAWTQSDNLARVDGQLWMATGDGRTPTAVHRWSGVAWETLATLPAGGVSAVAADDDGLYVAITYPGRGIWHVDLQGRVTVPHPPTNAIDTDVMDVQVTDLTGDGEDDLFVALGAWHGYALRVMVRDGDAWRVLSETPQGVVRDTAILPGAPPLVLAGKVDVEIDRRTFGAESPMGPEAGVHAYTAGPEGLEPRAFWPLPVPDDPETSYVQVVENPQVGDFDGDGTEDVAWTLARMSSQVEGHLWILFDVRRAIEAGEVPRSSVVWGLIGHSASDVDGDGDAELLVKDDTTGELFEWGTGEHALPTYDTSPPPAAPLPEGATDEVRHIWGRAAELTRLGLSARASRQLALTPTIAAEPAIQHEALVWAARISQQTGDLEAARDQLRAALALRDDPALRSELELVLIDTLDLPGAQALGASDAAWMDAPVHMVATPGLEGWDLERVGVLAPGAPLRVMNDHGVVARRPVEVVGSWVQLDLDGVIHSLELGAGLSVELERGGETLLSAGVWGQGGGGSTKVYQTCGSDLLQHLGVELLHTPHPVRLSVARTHDGRLHCRGVRNEQYPSAVVAPGPAELVLKAYGDPSYHPPAAAEVELTVRAVGLVPVDGAPDLAARARRALAAGDASGTAPRGEEVWWARARGESLDGVLEPDADRRGLRWLLRTEDPDVLQAMYGRPDFPALFEETFMPLLVDPRGHRLALLPPLTAFPVSDAAARRVLVVRAQASLERGDFASARLIASRVAAWDGVESAVSDAALLLAQLDPESRWEHLERAVRTSSAPDRLVRAVLHRPGLEDVDPARLRALLSR